MSDFGTNIGVSAELAGDRNARVAPNTAAMAKIAVIFGVGCKDTPNSASTPKASAVMVISTILRRSSRSATDPANSDRQNSGRNCTSPTIPTNKALCSIECVSRASA
ncbi:hypothetical protein GALL_502050 [mine drainage metagenome]|uniref:Uncharacterized protein n=1 Tax=mine drainage metagenome TaxID=410659 RepID=A0A1J5PA79_9ZZZZ